MSNQLAHGDLFKNLYKREACGMSQAQRERKMVAVSNAIHIIENLTKNSKDQLAALSRLRKLLKIQLEELS